MYSFSSKRRAAATGAAGVMALGGLAAFGPISTADAATTAPTNYVCTVQGNAVPASVVGQSKLPKRIKQGRSLAGIPVKLKVTIPDANIHGIAAVFQFTELGGKVADGALRLTKPGVVRKVPLNKLSIPTTKVPPVGSDMLLTASGKTARKAKAPAKTGRYLVKMPKSFTFEPTSDSQIQVPSLPCTLKGKAGNFGHMRVIHR